MAITEDLPKPTTSYEHLIDIELEDARDGSTVRATSLWAIQPTLVFVVRRPGCKLCRSEARRLASWSELISGQLGIRMIAVVLERVNNEIDDFVDGYWKGNVYIDKDRGFYKAFGGGRTRTVGPIGLLKPKVITTIVKVAKNNEISGNFTGEYRNLGGLYLLRPGSQGIAYEFPEKIVGRFAPASELLVACKQVSPNAGDASVQAAVEKAITMAQQGKTEETCDDDGEDEGCY